MQEHEFLHFIGIRMSKRLSFYGLVALASICIFFLAFNQRYSSYLEHRLQPVISDVEIRPRTTKIQEPVTVSQAYITGYTENATITEIQEVVDQQRKMIKREMENYEYPNGKYGVNVSKLEDLVMEKDGRPVRSIILTSWRSGSTFLGDVVNAHPANFYHYEPLLDYGIVQIREPPLADESLTRIISLLNCEYKELDRYLNYGKTHPWVFNHNTHLWRQCQAHKRICWDPRFVAKFCRLFPFQSMKLVRLRLRAAEKLLAKRLRSYHKLSAAVVTADRRHAQCRYDVQLIGITNGNDQIRECRSSYKYSAKGANDVTQEDSNKENECRFQENSLFES